MADGVFDSFKARKGAAEARLKKLKEEEQDLAEESGLGWLSPILSGVGALVGGVATLGNPAGIAAGAAGGGALGKGITAASGEEVPEEAKDVEQGLGATIGLAGSLMPSGGADTAGADRATALR